VFRISILVKCLYLPVSLETKSCLMFSTFTVPFLGLGLLHSCKKDLWPPHRPLLLRPGLQLDIVLALTATHFFKTTIKLAALLCQGGHARPGAFTNIPLVCAMWPPDADNCYQLLSASLNIPMLETCFSLYTLVKLFRSSRITLAMLIYYSYTATKAIAKEVQRYLQNLVPSSTNAQKFLYRIRRCHLMSAQLRFCI
jgi:hypothetical protein